MTPPHEVPKKLDSYPQSPEKPNTKQDLNDMAEEMAENMKVYSMCEDILESTGLSVKQTKELLESDDPSIVDLFDAVEVFTKRYPDAKVIKSPRYGRPLQVKSLDFNVPTVLRKAEEVRGLPLFIGGYNPVEYMIKEVNDVIMRLNGGKTDNHDVSNEAPKTLIGKDAVKEYCDQFKPANEEELKAIDEYTGTTYADIGIAEDYTLTKERREEYANKMAGIPAIVEARSKNLEDDVCEDGVKLSTHQTSASRAMAEIVSDIKAGREIDKSKMDRFESDLKQILKQHYVFGDNDKSWEQLSVTHDMRRIWRDIGDDEEVSVEDLFKNETQYHYIAAYEAFRNAMAAYNVMFDQKKVE